MNVFDLKIFHTLTFSFFYFFKINENIDQMNQLNKERERIDSLEMVKNKINSLFFFIFNFFDR